MSKTTHVTNNYIIDIAYNRVVIIINIKFLNTWTIVFQPTAATKHACVFFPGVRPVALWPLWGWERPLWGSGEFMLDLYCCRGSGSWHVTGPLLHLLVPSYG